MLCSVPLGGGGADSSSTPPIKETKQAMVTMRRRKVGHDNLVHDNALLFLSRTEWSWLILHTLPNKENGELAMINGHALLCPSRMEWS